MIPERNVRECHRCGEFFGTVAVWRAHLGERGCKTPKVLNREGFWQGYMDIWWSKDLGWDDTTHDWMVIDEFYWDEEGNGREEQMLPIINT